MTVDTETETEGSGSTTVGNQESSDVGKGEETEEGDDQSEVEPPKFRFPFGLFGPSQEEQEISRLQRELGKQREALTAMQELLEEEVALLRMGARSGGGNTSSYSYFLSSKGGDNHRSTIMGGGRNRGSSHNLRIARKVEKRLPEDSFSLLFTTAFPSQPFFAAFMISMFQFMAYTLVCLSVIDADNTNNPGNFPANVPIVTRFAQAIALIILIPLQDEILESLIMINDGHENKVFERTFAGCTWYQFAISVALRFLVGLLGIFTSFLLITGESQVLEIFFNFIALQFINQIDNLAFTFALEGILGNRLQGECIKVSETVYYTSREFHRHIHLFLLFFFVVGCWIFILIIQQRGFFVPESVEVQFSDDVIASLSYFSGVYFRDGDGDDLTGRFRYSDRTSKGDAFFGYCRSLEAWTFVHSSNDPCDWVARSETTTTYLITDPLQWFVRDINDNMVPLTPLYLSCFECIGQKNPCEHNGVYNAREKKCICPEDRFGRRCEYASPCPKIVLDTSDVDHRFPEGFPIEYEILKHNGTIVNVYNKPVYVDNVSQFFVVMYAGRRWIATSVLAFGDTQGDLGAYLAEGIHLFYTNVFGILITVPSDIGTTSDNSFPKSLLFQRVVFFPDGGQVGNPLFTEPATFDCAVCDDALNPCSFGNPCVNGTCNCIDGSSGLTCKNRPWGNGMCNVGFNTFVHQYDLGDCCEGSCISSSEHHCGYNGTKYIGFPNCVDEFYSCAAGTQCWSPNAEILNCLRPSGVASVRPVVVLAPNGRVMVVGNPLYDIVQVFDRDDSLWVQRGDDIYGPRNSMFGSSIAVSTPDDSILDSVVAPVGIRIAIGMFGLSGASVRVVEWSDSRTWTPLRRDTPISSSTTFGSTISLHFQLGGVILGAHIDSGSLVTFNVEEGQVETTPLSCQAESNVCSGLQSAAFSDEGKAVLLSASGESFHSFRSADFLWDSYLPLDFPYPGLRNRISLSRSGQVSVVARTESFSSTTMADATSATTTTTGQSLLNSTVQSQMQFFARSADGWSFLGDPVALGPVAIATDVALSRDGQTAAVGISSGEPTRRGRRRTGLDEVRVFQFKMNQGWLPRGDPIVVERRVSSISLSHDASVLAVADQHGGIQSYSVSPYCDEEDEIHVVLFILVGPGFDSVNRPLMWSLTVTTESSNRVVQSPVYPSGTSLKIKHQYCLPKDACLMLDLRVPSSDSSALDDSSSFFLLNIDNQEELHTPLFTDSFLFGC